MEQITLRSPHSYPLRDLIEGALANETRLLQAGIRRTEERLHAYEEKYRLSTAEFLQKHADDELNETLDLIDWIGEARMLERLRQKLAVLQDIQIAN